jgi:hypothetical protein
MICTHCLKKVLPFEWPVLYNICFCLKIFLFCWGTRNVDVFIRGNKPVLLCSQLLSAAVARGWRPVQGGKHGLYMTYHCITDVTLFS